MSIVGKKTRPYSIGIVGKPNVGKSTFFSAATLAPAEIANYPFTTIKPNRGIGYIRTPCVHEEFNVKDNPVNSLCLDGVRLIPVELIDCAGLVPGAWQGRGLGNQFLDEIRKSDALIHIVDAAGATDIEGRQCKLGMHDPLEDVRFLEVEITMWIANILKRDWAKLARTVESGGTGADLLAQLEERLSGLSIKRGHIFEALHKAGLNADKPASWSEEVFLKFIDTLRRVAKPMLVAANKIDLLGAEENVGRLKQQDYFVIPCSAEAELALRRAAEKGWTDYKPGDCNYNILKPDALTETQRGALRTIKERILTPFGTTGVQEAINAAYFKLLNCIVVYPVEDIEKLSNHKGEVLPDAYIVPYGTTARQLAYLIHTELGDNFIYAVEAREKKRIGEDHVLKDRDVVSIVSAKKRA
ncbi:MAG: redox-regulated ATPase YchF [Candidatus Bathyarchaeota archaeon]|nr:redox-regulated ATPase YchF [Candidatus Bathyarchaeota archaeon]MDH5495287.1 redox-regulated ATPase YchF [Candidatus Bathyarchaeota archaeon]